MHTTEGSDTELVCMIAQAGSNDRDADANSVLIQLDQSDVVSVQLWGNGAHINSIASAVTSSFSGFLLFQ